MSAVVGLRPAVDGRRRRPTSLDRDAMPELPEVEITARLIGAAVAGAAVESALSPGVNALRTYDPPLSAIEGRRSAGVSRRGKLFLVQLEGELTALLHLMSAGRLQLFDKRASLRDRTSRLLVRLDDGRELRLREFGTKQARVGQAATGPRAWPQEEMLDHAGTRGLARSAAAAGAARRAAAAARHAARPARDRRDRPLVGRRDPARGEALAVQARLRALRRGGRAPARGDRSTASAARSRTTSRR